MLDFKSFAIDSQAIQNIPAGVFWLIIGIVSLFLLLFLYRSYKNLIKTSVMQDTPTAKIRSAAQGYVELQGKQYRLPKEPIMAPLSKRPCTWYSYTIEHQRRKGWVILEYGTSSGLFELRDDTGRCIVDPNGAQVNTSLKESWYGYTPTPQPRPKSFIGRLLCAFGRYRYREWRMEEEMGLYALGNFHTVYVDNKEDVKESLQSWNTRYQQFLSVFLPKPIEKISAKQLSQLLENANQEMRKNSSSANRQEINVLSKEGLNSRMPYILSSIDPHKMTFLSKLSAFLWFFGYLMLLIIGGWLLVARF